MVHEFKIGDKVTYRHAQEPDTIIGIHKDIVWLMDSDDDHYTTPIHNLSIYPGTTQERLEKLLGSGTTGDRIGRERLAQYLIDNGVRFEETADSDATVTT